MGLEEVRHISPVSTLVHDAGPLYELSKPRTWEEEELSPSPWLRQCRRVLHAMSDLVNCSPSLVTKVIV